MLQAIPAGIEMSQTLHVRDGEVRELVVGDVEVLDRAEIGREQTDGVPLQQQRAELWHRGEGSYDEFQLVTGYVERV